MRNQNSSLRRLILTTAAFGALASVSTLHAQETGTAPSSDEGTVDASSGPAEIVVTADKRETTVQKVPIAITAISGDDLRAEGITDVASLGAKVPSFNYGESFGAVKLSIRGISYSNLSTGAEGGVAYNLNDVYIARPAGQLGNFYDLARIEVLRGPQGTLYGRNATGGALNVHTTRPGNEWSGYGNFTVGNYNDMIIEAAVGGPVTDGVGVRLAFFGENRDGYGKNIVTGNDVDNAKSRAARLTLAFEPTSNLSIDIIGDIGHQRDNSKAAHVIASRGLTGEPGVSGQPILGVRLGGTALFESYDIANEIDPQYLRDTGGVLVDAKLELGAVTLRSLTAWRHTLFKLNGDLDGTNLGISRILYNERTDQYTQEFNLSYTGRSLDFILGAYMFAEDLDGNYWAPADTAGGSNFIANFASGGLLKTRGLAGYGQASWHIDDRLTLILGARYSSEKKTDADLYTDFTTLANPATSPIVLPADFANPNPPFAPDPFVQSKRWNSFTPKVGLNFQLDSQTLLYATVSKGFKSGLYNLGGTTVAIVNGNRVLSNPPVNPETVWAYEAGLKTRMLDGKLRFNLAGFYYDYSGLQLTKVNGFVTQLTNAAAAEIYGLELETNLQATDNLSLNLSASWLHARFTDFVNTDTGRPSLGPIDLKGNQLPQAPEWNISGGIQYRAPVGNGDLTAALDANYVSRNYFDEFNIAAISQPGFAKVDASLSYQTESGFEVTAFIKNITDKKTIETAYLSTVRLGFPINGVLAPPRTYGVRFGYRF